MAAYEDTMVRCACEQKEWYGPLREHLHQARKTGTAPLFDTRRWVQNFEAALALLVSSEEARRADVRVQDVQQQTATGTRTQEERL